MKSIGINWKTTAAGAALLLLAAAHSLLGIDIPGIVMPDLTYGTIVIAFGLIFAKDGNVTGGTTVQPSK